MHVTIQECNYCEHISCGRDIASMQVQKSQSYARLSQSMHHDVVACREVVAIGKSTRATQKNGSKERREHDTVGGSSTTGKADSAARK